MSVTFADESSIRDAVADVRSDKTDTNFVVLTYEGDNTIKLLASGTGGVGELASHLDDKIVAYGIVRVTEKFDESEIVRFVFIKWQGTGIPRMLKARVGTHTGSVKDIFSPYHVDIDADTLKELDESVVRDVVRKNAGIASRVLDKTHSTPPGVSTAQYKAPSPSSGRTASAASSSPSGVPKESSSLSFAGKSEIDAALADLRSDTSDTNWILITYDGPNSNSVVLLGSGAGGAAELISHLKDDIVAYGLVREVHKFDHSDTVKFAYINWRGQNIARMLRARLGTHSGAIKDYLQPFHCDLTAEKPEEISPEIISTLIKTNMGTATRVRGQ